MRKDYIEAAVADEDDEIAFVEKYWTDVWEREGGPKGAIDQIPRKAEYKIMRPYIESLPKGARILDGGCGLGDWTLYLTKNGWKALGLDISRATVDQLTARFPEAEFIVGDIRDTGLEPASVDAYFSWGTFEHFEEGLDRCIAEAMRILKPGGYLFTSVPYDNLRHAILASSDWRRRRPAADRPRRFYQWRLSRGEFRDLLASNGFDILDMRTIHKRQGVMRSLHHELGLPYGFLNKAAGASLAPFLPGGLIAHMIMAVARKPLDDRST